MIKVPDGTLRILVQGAQRVRDRRAGRSETPYLVAEIDRAARRRRASRPS